MPPRLDFPRRHPPAQGVSALSVCQDDCSSVGAAATCCNDALRGSGGAPQPFTPSLQRRRESGVHVLPFLTLTDAVQATLWPRSRSFRPCSIPRTFLRSSAVASSMQPQVSRSMMQCFTPSGLGACMRKSQIGTARTDWPTRRSLSRAFARTVCTHRCDTCHGRALC